MKSFLEYKEITEAKTVNLGFIKSIPRMDGDFYIFIMGGSASGKNYFYEKNLGRMPLVDVDAFTKKLSKGDDSVRGQYVAKAIHMVNKDIDQKLVDRQSFVQTGTGANYKGLYNRLKKAKDAGFNVVVILVETDVETVIKRNEKRVKSGGHGATLSVEKMKRTREYAAENFKKLKASDVVDYAVKVNT